MEDRGGGGRQRGRREDVEDGTLSTLVERHARAERVQGQQMLRGVRHNNRTGRVGNFTKKFR